MGLERPHRPPLRGKPQPSHLKAFAPMADASSEPQGRGAWAVFLVFLRLGLTSFGGPVAHLGYFRTEFVERRRWLSERAYADIVALSQFLPGPASSQVGMALGLIRAGYRGAFAAWAGFTLPSAVALILFALGLTSHGETIPTGALHGLKVVAVAVVAQAVWGMARSLCPDAPRIAFMLAAAAAVVLLPGAWTQVGVIALAAVAGGLLFRPPAAASHDPMPLTVGPRAGMLCLLLFAALLIGLPLLVHAMPTPTLLRIDSFYRVGSLVFGGGHVALPLLQAEVVPNGWVDNDTFLAGYGATQAVPGPLFTFAAFLGATMSTAPSGWAGGLIALVAVFAPSFLLIAGAMPFWARLRVLPKAQATIMGVNAAVVGLLLAALYDPVWTSAILSVADLGLAMLALAALMQWKLPPWAVVIGCGLAGWALAGIS